MDPRIAMVPMNRFRRRSSGESRSSGSSLEKKTLPPPPPPPSHPLPSPPQSQSDTTTVLVGAKQLAFNVNKKLLCEVSPFFSQRLQDNIQTKPVCLWLPSESSTMFALFIEWVHSPSAFRHFLDHSISTAHDTSQQASQDIHWAIIRLHLFASHLDLFKLQDLAMDALQDLYLNYDWDVPPNLITYLYTQCEAVPAVRVRRWAVAMVAFSLAVDNHDQQLKFHPQDSATSDPARFRALFSSLPDFAYDYATHVRNMKAAGLDVRCKNPQLRISANKLRNDQRLFGFRECSFHSHRAAVGERRCPHNEGRGRSRHASELLSLAEGGHSSTGGEPACMPRPLFSIAEQDKGRLKHMRSISSGLRAG
ncbi:hypothetical protein QQS21_006396 [Conoideocrella luteorostrata]|uniref:BTB domain-containing protein n=1 Tax=Conoideocrella luteorostrata TaxID=1105319 RepID=A0AAJ0CQ35_9HYPO|nr:hypothetical protein QQS21_006396 [Conoideocrella luteorostrata]